MFRRSLAALALCALVGPSAAHDYKAAGLSIGHPWSRATAPGAKVGGGFLTIRNDGPAADRLVGASLDVAGRTELHESSVEDGIARMRPLQGGVPIGPGETVTFAPGGKHLMFMELRRPLTKGERIKGELDFEKAGRVAVEFAVEAPGAAAADDHAQHSGSGPREDASKTR